MEKLKFYDVDVYCCLSTLNVHFRSLLFFIPSFFHTIFFIAQQMLKYKNGTKDFSKIARVATFR